MRVAVWKMVDIVVSGLMALLTSVLFPWWAGAVVFGLCLGLVFGLKRQETAWQRKLPKGDKAIQEDEWYYYHYQLHHSDPRKD